MLKKIMIGLGGLVALLVLAGAVFWFGWLVPPSGEQVCDNLSAITKQETGSELPPMLREKCIEGVGTPPKFGRLKWVSRLKCMQDAGSMSELRSCDSRMVSQFAATVR